MKNYYLALRCFLLDFWDHAKGECAPTPDPALHRAIYQAADTNISSVLGSNVITDVPRCLHLVGGGRVCWMHCVRGEEFAGSDPQVGAAAGLNMLHCFQFRTLLYHTYLLCMCGGVWQAATLR